MTGMVSFILFDHLSDLIEQLILDDQEALDELVLVAVRHGAEERMSRLRAHQHWNAMACLSLRQKREQSLKRILIPIQLLLLRPEIVKHFIVGIGQGYVEGEKFVDFVGGVEAGDADDFLAVSVAIFEQELDHL